MKLDLKVSFEMTRLGEDDLIRLPSSLAEKLGVEKGAELLLSSKKGESIRVTVASMYLVDYQQGEGAYVSSRTYSRVRGHKPIPRKVTLGCDPEFIFLDAKQKVLPANYWLPTLGAIGNDGPLAELRPEPADSELDVVENLRKLIKTLPLMMKDRFGSSKLITPQGHSCIDNYALGFHIHIGAPPELITYAAPGAEEFIRSYIAVLDYFVGIPAMLLEDTSTRRLGNGQYGKPGDFRISRKTIEYRTPGGYHLRHPEYAAGIMGLTLCVARELLEDAEEESGQWQFLDKFSSFKRMQEKYSLPNKSMIRWSILEPTKEVAVQQLGNLLPQLYKLRYFSKHEKSIRNYFRLILENKQYSPNLLENW